MIDIIFIIIFITCIAYIIQYRMNIKKAAEMSTQALFPRTEREFNSILIPAEWKEMQPISKHSRSYQYVKWATLAALILLFILLVVVLTTDWIESSLFSSAYLFFILIKSVQHKGCLFILSKGVIINGKFYHPNQISSYQTEKIIRWHELYGYSTRVDNGYKLTLFHKKSWLNPSSYVVVENEEHLKKITSFLDHQGIVGNHKEQTT